MAGAAQTSRHAAPEQVEQRYSAFLSYSQALDGMLADKLQSALQTYARPWYRARVRHIFRDRTDLSATPELWPVILEALARSRHLILLASPEAANSKWVAAEVQQWLSPYLARTCGQWPRSRNQEAEIIESDRLGRLAYTFRHLTDPGVSRRAHIYQLRQRGRLVFPIQILLDVHAPPLIALRDLHLRRATTGH